MWVSYNRWKTGVVKRFKLIQWLLISICNHYDRFLEVMLRFFFLLGTQSVAFSEELRRTLRHERGATNEASIVVDIHISRLLDALVVV